jgi:hypothetical protein
MDHHPDRAAALASLWTRWGAAAPRPAMEVFGALAAASRPAEAGVVAMLPAPVLALPVPLPGEPPLPARPGLVPFPGGGVPAPAVRPLPGEPARDAGRVIPTGFAELDALLARGGLPRAGTVVLRGTGSSGATTLALRTLAEAQAGGALVAWVDLARSLDPVEAAARGVRLEWLAVLVPESAEEALAMAGSLLQARAVDVLVLDLAGGGSRAPEPRPTRGSRAVDRLARLVAFARRAGALLLVLEPAGASGSLRSALTEGVDLRLELRRHGWIRLGREVVGQRTEIRVAKDRHGMPDRRTAIRLLYAEGGPRDRCLARDDLLVEAAAGDSSVPGPVAPPGPAPLSSSSSPSEHQESTDAPPPPLLASSGPAARAAARPGNPGCGTTHPRRAAVG